MDDVSREVQKSELINGVATMKKTMLLTAGVAFILLSGLGSLSIHQAHAQVPVTTKNFSAPIVFQAAGPSVASIQESVAQYRIALGEPNNGNNASKESGRREINWDGAANNLDTAVSGNPLSTFLVTRGALFSTPDGSGFVRQHQQVSQVSSITQPTERYSRRSANFGFSAPLAATSRTLISSYLAATTCQQQPKDLVLSLLMWISRMEADRARSSETVTPAR